MITLFQIVFSSAFFYLFLKTLYSTKKSKNNKKFLTFWSLIWLSASILIAIPNFSSELGKIFGIGRGVDFVIYVSIFVLFLIIYKLYLAYEKARRDIKSLNSHIALLEERMRRYEK